eukprot:gene7348-14997_t
MDGGRYGFGSNTERQVLSKMPPKAAVGPGSYAIPSALRKSLPNYVGFASTSKRSSIAKSENIPAPGSYELELKGKLTGLTMTSTAFKSRTKRFEDEAPPIPGPGSYDVLTCLHSSPRAGPRRMNRLAANAALLNPAITLGVPQPPSIPTKFQSYGYEDAQDGRLVLQEPTRPGFTGIKGDTVGPGDYEPDSGVKFKKAPMIDFSRGQDRMAFFQPGEDDEPGPGTYEPPSLFPTDSNEGGASSSGGDRISFSAYASKNRQMAIFQSNTTRGQTETKIGPGPAEYNLPELFNPKTLPVSKQCFDSTSDRFKDPVPASMRLKTCPGSYDPITSDFDQLRLRVLKEKRMSSRSSWAQNIAFSGTQPRFQLSDTDVPAPGAYSPKNSMVDTLDKPNPRAGPFGSKTKRSFLDNKKVSTTKTSRANIAAGLEIRTS